MRERLVELLGCEGTVITENDFEIVADYLLANGVIVPPCKVGDKVYYIYNNNVFDLTIGKIVQKEEGLFLVDKAFQDWYSVKEIGKTLYLTREEAEAKLKEGGKGWQ